MIFSLNTKEWDINKEGVTMFEKEAVDRILQQFGTAGELIVRTRIWEDGAEFGYSKGYHDAEEHYLNVIDSQHKLVDASMKDYFKGNCNNADGWHYYGVPHDNKPYLCKVIHPKSCEMTDLEILFYDEKDMSWFRWLTLWSGEEGNDIARINRKVLAWKEIIPSKRVERKIIKNIKWYFTPCRKCKSKDIEGLVSCSCTRGIFKKKWKKKEKKNK